MDYVYSGPPEWPLVSTLASVVGVGMMLARHISLGWNVLADQALDDLNRALERLAQPWVACVALLALPIAWPTLPLIRTLQGVGRLDSEIKLARADGYYEELIRSSRDRRATRPTGPAPGRKAFADSGLVAEVADYRRRVLRPGLDSRWNGAAFRTNALGFRSPEISREKPPGTLRVLVLGSSNTMGHGVEDEESYPRLLERWLAQQVLPGKRVEVVNLAVSGDSPTQRLLRLRLEGPGLEPDWIVADATALDTSLEEQHLRWVVDHGIDPPFDFVREVLSRSGIGPTDSPDEAHGKLLPHLQPLLDGAFDGWAAEASRLGVPLTVAILPRADSKTASPGLFRLLVDMAGRHGLRHSDLSDVFDRLELDDYRISAWDFHPNPLGHRLIFQGLRNSLIADQDFHSMLKQ